MFHVKHRLYYIIIPKIKTFQKSIPNQIFNHHLKTQTHKSHTQLYLDTNTFIVFPLVRCLNHHIFLKATTNSHHTNKIQFYFLCFLPIIPHLSIIQTVTTKPTRVQATTLINKLTTPYRDRINICHIHTNTHRTNIHHVAQIVAYCTMHDAITQQTCAQYTHSHTHIHIYALCTHITKLFCNKTHKPNPPSFTTFKPIL